MNTISNSSEDRLESQSSRWLVWDWKEWRGQQIIGRKRVELLLHLNEIFMRATLMQLFSRPQKSAMTEGRDNEWCKLVNQIAEIDRKYTLSYALNSMF